MFDFDLKFEEVPIVIDGAETSSRFDGVAHYICDRDGGSVVDITLELTDEGGHTAMWLWPAIGD